jgi:hypothetical protein
MKSSSALTRREQSTVEKICGSNPDANTRGGKDDRVLVLRLKSLKIPENRYLWTIQLISSDARKSLQNTDSFN